MRLRLILIALTLMLFAASPGAAQNWTIPVEEFVTQSQVLIVYPAIYTPEELDPFTVVFSGFDDGDVYNITVTTGVYANQLIGQAGSLTDGLSALLDESLARYDLAEREFFGLSNATAWFQYAQTFTGNAYYAAISTGEGIDTEYTVIEMRSPTATQTEMRAQRETLLNMTGSLKWRVDPLQFATPLGSLLETVALPPGALLIEQMPEGRIVFTTGVQMALPDGWTVANPGTAIADGVELVNASGDAELFISTTDLSMLSSVDEWRNQILQIIGGLVTIDDTSGEPKGVVLDTEAAQSGVTVEYFAPGEFGLSLHFVSLNREAGAALQTSLLDPANTGRNNEIMAEVAAIGASFERINRTDSSATPTPPAVRRSASATPTASPTATLVSPTPGG